MKLESAEAYFDVCGLITKEAIAEIQGSPITDTKSSGRLDGGLRVSQCYYAATEPSKSVSLALTQHDPSSPGKRRAKDFWKESFDPYKGELREREGDEEKRESPAGNRKRKNRARQNRSAASVRKLTGLAIASAAPSMF